MNQIPKITTMQINRPVTLWDVFSVSLLMGISVWATAAILGWW